MKPLPGAEVRARYLRFFEERGHKRMPSDSLVPANDPTLLFTGAGMNQFKDMFLGRGHLPYKRVTTAQKCLRVPDLENVGLTPRHHTFFEMLGNFSFGDYFKKDCLEWEWQFFTEVLGIPADRLVATVYLDDDEAYTIWREHIGLPAERIFRFGEKENFWPAEAPSKGPNGPCGPCSEIYFDGRPGTAYPKNEGLTSLPDDRFTEIGNCVFTQFDRQADGSLTPLPQRNIDVGLGLERITAVLHGAKNNFETDLFRPYLDHLGKLAKVAYGSNPQQDVRMRRISDHVRAVTFCIADGALPSNEGRGYVVRKILRRAVRDGYDLGIDKPFLHDMVGLVGDVMGEEYPEVREHAGQCRSVIKGEEESFVGVYRQGLARLEQFLSEHGSAVRGAALPASGTFAFQLHDTYGFPVDITRTVMAERGFVLDEPGFEAAMEAQRTRARAAMATTDAVFAESAAAVLRQAGVGTSEFVGYGTLIVSTPILALLDRDNRACERVEQGQEVSIVLGETPFYAQGGGQVGDRGTIASETGRAEVRSTTVLEGYWLQQAVVAEGGLAVGQLCEARVDEVARRATERNHTATHLLHAALKRVLGAHVSQAGSEVSPDRLRFDYTHGERLGEEQIARLEEEVNAVVIQAAPVEPRLMPLDAAKKAGFVAMFGEKYGETVRTLTIGDYSRELCGGTHVANSGNIGSFRIVAEGAISAGTRRIEAVTGLSALALAQRDRATLGQLATQLKVPAAEVLARVGAVLDEGKQLRKALEKATAADLDKLGAEMRAQAQAVGDAHVAVLATHASMTMKEVQELLARVRQALTPFAGAVLAPAAGEVLVGAAVSAELSKRVSAADLVKAATSVLGGGGGGRPEMAQGKGKDSTKLAAAGEAVLAAIRAALAP
ncbi:MAG: alanine--tRNA ligase [Planctomycetota bacterium]